MFLCQWDGIPTRVIPLWHTCYWPEVHALNDCCGNQPQLLSLSWMWIREEQGLEVIHTGRKGMRPPSWGRGLSLQAPMVLWHLISGPGNGSWLLLAAGVVLEDVQGGQKGVLSCSWFKILFPSKVKLREFPKVEGRALQGKCRRINQGRRGCRDTGTGEEMQEGCTSPKRDQFLWGSRCKQNF